MLMRNLKLRRTREVLREIAEDEVRTVRTWVLDGMAVEPNSR